MIVELAIRRIRNQILAGVPVEQIMILVFKDLVEEANKEVLSTKPDTVEKVARIFEDKALQWEQICFKMKGANLNPWGFRLLLRQYSPNMFKAIANKGFAGIPQDCDPEYVPSKKKRHKKGTNHDGSVL